MYLLPVGIATQLAIGFSVKVYSGGVDPRRNMKSLMQYVLFTTGAGPFLGLPVIGPYVIALDAVKNDLIPFLPALTLVSYVTPGVI